MRDTSETAMSKIKHLTSQQEAALEHHAEKWIGMGLATGPCDERYIKSACNELYTTILQEDAPNLVLFCDSPLGAGLLAALLSIRDGEINHELKARVEARVWDRVEARVGDRVGARVWDRVEDRVRARVWARVRARVGDRVGVRVRARVRARVGARVEDRVGARVRDRVWDRVEDRVGDRVWDRVLWPYLGGQFDSGWLSFYQYFSEYLAVEFTGIPISVLWQLANAGPVWPLEEICIISDRPLEIHRNSAGDLHKDGGPAVIYADGFAIHCLNGVSVPAWLAESPKGKLRARRFAEITNAEIRREFVRKLGVEALLSELPSECLETVDNYALFNVDLGGNTGKWPYLKMLNPSVGCWHLECVGRECLTVQQALNFRASGLRELGGLDWKPEELT